MKKLVSPWLRLVMTLAACLAGNATFAKTFTNNFHIGPADTTYDGSDIIVSNCTLTVDGTHGFASVRVATNGVLTHSFSANGSVSNLYYVTNETYILNGTFPVILNSNVLFGTISVADLTGTNFYTNVQDYFVSQNGNLTQLQRTASSAIPDGAFVLLSYTGFGANLGTVPAGLFLAVTNNVQVDLGGAINVNGAGFGAGPGVGFGSGSPFAGGGGGYGGNGGGSASGALGGASYGLYNTTLANLGSGGGSGASGAGGPGGGLIQITSGGNVILNGLISANGANGTNDRSGGGSGGGIYINGLSILGSGLIAANGGAGEPADGGGGGGGRIVLQSSSSSFTGSMTAIGGAGFSAGSAGTVYTKVTGQNGLLVLDNNGKVSTTNTTLSVQSSTDNLLIRSNAGVLASGFWTIGSLTVASNGLLVAGPLTVLNLSANGPVTVQPGGGIIADSKGSAANAGSGPGRSYNDSVYFPCGGGGYGGNGAASPQNSNASGGITYGTPLSPSGFGSGGGSQTPYSIGGSGGGSIQITVNGNTLQVDGVISASGGNGGGIGGGGGSGGTISLVGGTLVGSGSIRANGGNGVDSIGGGGGGGRVYLTPTVNLFAGTISAYGGAGGNVGGAGTVVINIVNSSRQLILDNNGHLGTNTPLPSDSDLDLVVRGGAIASAQSSVSFANLYVSSNAWLAPYYSQTLASGITFTFTGNATIQPGGGIIADSAGSAPGIGIGAGRTTGFGSTNLCGGAGHGGFGGNSFGNYALGGGTYDSANSPSQPGSGGGSSLPNSPGGYGGGVIRISATGTLQVDGIISANGGGGSGLAGGGGSGGSIWLSAGTLAGAGAISANGGKGVDSLGGGGSGGMIFLSCNNNSFAGTTTACGGSGANRGGAGTTVIQLPGKNAQVVVDAGGNPGGITPLTLPNSASMDVTLRNGAVGSASSSLSLGNFVIGANSTLLASNLINFNCASLNLQAGGSIIADAQNPFGAATGRAVGTPPVYPCGGGGNGGPGGNSISNLASGGVNLTYYLASIGSAGGSESPYSIGGFGGGLLSITTTGLMQIDGLISANGGNGSGLGGGGGSGGAITLTSGLFAGTGNIRANGGAGAGANGGGGGGGSIFIVVNSAANQFNGTMTAYGGSGANWGGTGPISIQTSGQATQYILDAGGNPTNTPTPINPSSTVSLALRNNAIAQIGMFSSSLTFGNVLLASNSWLLVSNSTLTLLNCSNVTIQTGCGISVDSMGSPSGLGTGAGHNYSISPNYPCSGAGHGGIGGNSISNLAAGGLAYDSPTSPSTAGSGGGTFAPYSIGGNGGGDFILNASGLVQVDGIISDNGGNGGGIGGGGGSGGSLRINAGTLSGVGQIRANGGAGVGLIGGGGGGGIVALYPTSYLFAGIISAGGGSGANYGGAGTIYIQTNGTQTGQLIVDNAGQSGAPTPIQSALSTTSLVLRNGAIAYQQNSSQTFANLTIGPNAWLTASSNNALVNLTITGNATIQSGGGIITDNLGSGPGIGTGAGHIATQFPYFAGGGGSYGGLGANGITNEAGGGQAYASVTTPAGLGSGGGQYLPYSRGGAGGGSIRLNVTGTLDNEGKISANGGNGSGLGGGGGSGGSVYLTVGTLAGNGAVAANGGNGASNGGGGGGGRISVVSSANSFVGLATARGGGGFANGGAGTIYTSNLKSGAQVLVDNGGLQGANTPLSTALGASSTPFNLVIQNGGTVSPQANALFPELSNLTIGAGGTLTGLVRSTLDLLVVSNVDVVPGGAIVVDGEGYQQYPQPVGPGSGQTSGGFGSGAGYGGVGGATVGVGGGASYGSALQPVDFGSGGGLGTGTTTGISGGGGALRMNVGGVLTIDGELSAEGDAGIQDDSGGASGGSIWVTAGTLAGGGLVAADGGEGELYYGGGGAGGRIALYSRANAFFGSTSADGGVGYVNGGNGTVVISNTVPTLQVLSNSPSGIVSNAVSSVVIYFNEAPKPASVTASAFSMKTPYGFLTNNPFSISMLSPSAYQVSFPQQTAVGDYSMQVGPGIVDLYGRQGQSFVGTFTISLPVVQGIATDTNGNPLSGVLMQPTVGSATTTDINGNYAIGFVPGSTFAVTPSLNSLIFVPSSISYTNVSTSLSNQNYTAYTTLTPAVAASMNSASFALNWQAISGVNYQIYCSSDLTNWVPWGGPATGSNGSTQILMAIGTNQVQFFSVQPSQ